MSSKNSPTRVAISAGDPNGIGIETVVKAFADERMFTEVTPVLYAVPNLVEAALTLTELTDRVKWAVVDGADHAKANQLNVVAIQEEPWELNWGQITAEAGTFAFQSLERAVQDLAATRVEVLVTCPIHKDAMKLGSFKFPGHTEYLADFANVDDVIMLLVAGELRVGVATGHIALKDVSQALSTSLIRTKINLLHESLLRDFGLANPRIAVMGLNPHASDNGLMGDEEKKIIQPVIRELAAEDKLVFGPYAADGFFGSGAFKQFDGVLAMYHDQGLAPFKALSFGAGVNFTAGLPVVRTSPDHGTGFDIAGQGSANPDSLRSALFAARDIRRNRIEHRELTANPLEIKKKERRSDDYASRRRGE